MEKEKDDGIKTVIQRIGMVLGKKPGHYEEDETFLSKWSVDDIGKGNVGIFIYTFYRPCI